MNTGAISKRYAKALLELSRESGRGEQDCSQALALLEHPEAKPAKLEEDIQKLVELLIRNGRMPYVKFILRSFVDLYRKENGIVEVRLTMAAQSPALEEKLRQILASTIDGTILFTSKVDPDLIGGFVLEVDDRQLNASAKSQLEKIRRKLDELNKRIV
ncbi:MAG: F0F1 ATP synthase subunit delta [Bacteroidales bacterium]|nr:F0F1 ATP synthase subunit delta [Bacteroidales bacterium]